MTAHALPNPTELRLALRENGYCPVPVSGPGMNVNSAGKRPVMPAWERKCLDASPDEIRRWGTLYPDSTNTACSAACWRAWTSTYCDRTSPPRSRIALAGPLGPRPSNASAASPRFCSATGSRSRPTRSRPPA